MYTPISITAISSISALGANSNHIWEHYCSRNHFFTEKHGSLVAELPDTVKGEIAKLRNSNAKYKSLDDSVLFGIFVARKAMKNAGWTKDDNFGINIGSSRGATQLFENYHKDFLKHNKAETLSSPTTTLGNISSWVAHDLQTKGPTISHSITCSTALHAMLNGIAWLRSGMCNKFLVGGSEAPLTPFTIAQMQALRIYAQTQDAFPCKALDLNKTQNSMILGEAAAIACLEIGKKPNALAYIEGCGYSTELLTHNTSLSTEGECFQKAMQMATAHIAPTDVDVIITHTPGTIKGDLAEYNAIKKVFKNHMPALTTNKIKIGHSLGASGLISVDMAIDMLTRQAFITIPYLQQNPPKQLTKILVNAVGFGGNAVSILLSK